MPTPWTGPWDRGRLLPAPPQRNAGSAQQPVAAWSTRHASAIRAGASEATRRRNDSRRIVWTLSKLTTLADGTPSAVVNSSSETRPRRVRVSPATTTAPIRSATGSRVSTRTGRSPPGVAANQTSPRCIDVPIRPVLGGTPLGDLGERLLPLVEGLSIPPLGIALGRQSIEVTSERLSQQLGSIDSECFCPSLDRIRIAFVDSEAEHRHTTILHSYDSRSAGPTARHEAVAGRGREDRMPRSIPLRTSNDRCRRNIDNRGSVRPGLRATCWGAAPRRAP